MKLLYTSLVFIYLLVTLAIPTTLFAEENLRQVSDTSTASSVEKEDRSIGYRVLVYIPNRVLDLFDIFRVRVRVGPGTGIGVRATEVLSFNLASYASIYAGLPGPRQEPILRSPLGAEVYSGARASVFGIETENYGPRYSPTEFGLDLHILFIGASVGIDPIELVDFFTGFVGFEIVEDDL